MSIPRFPVPNALTSFWTEESHSLYNHRTTQELPRTSDIVIIGSGYAGASTAYHLLHEIDINVAQKSSLDSPSPPPLSVTILEARGACSGATGRNGGHVKPDTYFNVPKYMKLYGLEEARRIAKLEADGVKGVKELVEREGWSENCDFLLTRAVDVCLDQGHANACEKAYKELMAGGYGGLSDVQFVGSRDAQRISGVHGAKCAFTFTAGSVWPSKLVYNLLAKAIGRGANLQTHTPATSISSTTNASGYWKITTPRGEILAKKIIFATNAYTASLLPQFTNHIIPVKGICSHIAPVPGTTTPQMIMTSSIRHNATEYDYLIPRADGSIIVGGARSRFWSSRGKYFDTVDDSTLIPGAQDYFDDYMQRHYIGWKDVKTTTKVWTGIMGYSSDFMPHVGEIAGKQGQFVLAGFSGHGMPQILEISKAIAKMAMGGLTFEQSGLPKCFRTSKDRLSRERNELLENMKDAWESEKSAKL